MAVEWVTSERTVIWEVLGSSQYNPDGPYVKEGYGQVDTDGYLRSVNGLDPVGHDVIPWGGNFGGILVFKTEAEALQCALGLLHERITALSERVTEYSVRLIDEAKAEQGK